MFHKVRQVLLDLAARQTRDDARLHARVRARGKRAAANSPTPEITATIRPGWLSGLSFTRKLPACPKPRRGV